MKINKRDLFFFFMGMLALLLLFTLLDWENNLEAFKAGWDSYEH